MPYRKKKDTEAQESLRIFKARIFQALANPTRIQILELLKEKERGVSELLECLNVEQSNASQHLAVLRSKNLVSTRKEGNQVFYSLRDPVLGKVLDSLKDFFQAHLEEAFEVLRGLD